MIKKILVFGASGFIGFHLSKHLSKNLNNHLTLLDDNSRGQLDNGFKKLLEKKNVKFLKLDLTKQKSFRKLEKKYDTLYMLASVVGVNNTLSRPDKVIEINTLIIINTLIWLKKNLVKKVLFSSTSENYAGTIDMFKGKIPTPESIPLTISDITHPRFTYAATKILGESAFINFSKVWGIKVKVVRFHNIFGPRMGFKHVIPHLIERFYNNESPFKIYGPNQTRAFCFIDDAVKGIVKLMNSSEAKSEIYNIGSSQEVRIEKITKTIGQLFNYKGKYIEAKPFPGSTTRRCPDLKKSKKDFKYKNNFNLSKGMKITFDWYIDYFKKNKKIFEKSYQAPDEFKNVYKVYKKTN